ncbi:dethiobiotin synthase [Alteromonas sp. CYL-A6]|uniref:dethiobiotin synthase n=1 Tax=Alteromonas nitratireducens TaxID=3390813 RepID=UPI0034AD3DB3
MSSYFVTGTDTEVGKTYVSRTLLEAAAGQGRKTVGYKPVSAGCDNINGEWINEDAAALHQASSVKLSISEVNPVALKSPIAPHIAAQQEGRELREQDIIAGFAHLQQYAPDLLLMEGAGGWRLPLGGGRYLSDVVKTLDLPVIIVVGMRLGCLNHALLTAEAVQRDGLKIAGWVANQLSDDMPVYQQNLTYLTQAMPAPMLLEVPYKAPPSPAALQQLVEQIS